MDKTKPFTAIVAAEDRDAWLKARQCGLGASEVPSLFGLGFLSALRIWAYKTGKLEPEDLTDNEAVRWGNLLEQVVAEEYERQTQRTVTSGGWLLQSTEHPWALATPDVWWGDIPVQIKTTSAYRISDWAEGPPEAVRLQVHGEMLVSGAPMASVGVLVGGQRFLWADVERDEATIAAIIERGSAFWGRVQADEWPDMDGSEDETAALKQLWPTAVGEELMLPPDATDWTAQIEALNGDIKEMTAHRDVLRNTIKAAMGAAEIGRLPDGSGWTHRQQTRKAHEVRESTFRVLRRVQP